MKVCALTPVVALRGWHGAVSWRGAVLVLTRLRMPMHLPHCIRTLNICLHATYKSIPDSSAAVSSTFDL